MTKLFVGNLSWGTTDDSLVQAFSAYGNVTDAIVLKDRETGEHFIHASFLSCSCYRVGSVHLLFAPLFHKFFHETLLGWNRYQLATCPLFYYCFLI
ncbi:hypothetical protein CcCBS67573_g08405 [Chytriomyces confervae]|uniref:RRM domain-containing protein n=1 Tax=Chytriomyces confervae TaxID=246404 RepID=A0A507EK80_9FUNG|nr:hypothetical protein CcCBS67573_g08405 [Chytriomyces confervae]